MLIARMPRSPRSLLLLAFGVAVAGTRVNAQASTLDSTALALVLDSIRTAIGAPGASAALIFSDGRRWVGASGSAWEGQPVTPGTVFEVGSVTKSFTAALILSLVRDGLLNLDDSASKWLPGQTGLVQGATIRQLLQHTSGIADYARHPGFLPAIRASMAGPWTPTDNLRFVGEPTGTPGTEWRYSNTNYVLLGLIAAAAGKKPFADLLRERISKPLTLQHIFVAGEDQITDLKAHSYLDFNGDGKADDLSAFVPDPATTRGAGGAGAVIGTALDVAVFARAYYTGELLGSTLQHEVTSWRDRGDGWQYGLGVIRNPQGAEDLLGHLGNTAGQSAGVWHSPTDGVTAVLLTNIDGARMAPPVATLLRAATDGRARSMR